MFEHTNIYSTLRGGRGGGLATATVVHSSRTKLTIPVEIRHAWQRGIQKRIFSQRE